MSNNSPAGLAHWPARDVGALLTDSIGGVLTRRVAQDGDTIALWWPDGDGVGSMSYAELGRHANSVAHLLRELEPGERIAVWGRNSIEWVLLEYGCALRGLILVALNTAWTDVEATAALDLVKPALLFGGLDRHGEPSFAPRATGLVDRHRVRDLAELNSLPDAAPASIDVAAEQPFLIQFTSGTTGRAKGAVLSHRAALNAAYLRLKKDPGEPGDVSLNAVPFHHVGGSVSIVLGALATAGSFVVLDRFRADEAVRLLPLCGVTHLGGVPIMMEQLLDQLANTPEAGAALTTVALGGASVSPALVCRVQQQLGAHVLITYAQSECPMITNSGPDDPPELVANTVGFPAGATEVRVVDPHSGQTVGYREAGEIEVRSPMTMTEYFGMPEQSAEAFRPDGFLRTGDIGSMDPDGHLRIHDRVRDVIIRGGENVYPAEVEAALGEHPEIATCAVVGIPDERWGEQVGASIVFRNAAVETAMLEAFLAERLAHFKIPRVWRVVDELPLTASGKIRRNIVRDAMSVTAV